MRVKFHLNILVSKLLTRAHIHKYSIGQVVHSNAEKPKRSCFLLERASKNREAFYLVVKT